LPGKCAADGQPHSTEGSGAYLLNFDVAERPNFQANWRWCSRCQGLWYGPGSSRCPAGGAHSQEGSGNYVLNIP